jgi:hypothetical protein
MMSLDWLGRCIERSGWGNGKGHFSFNKCVTWTNLMLFAALIGAVIWWIVVTRTLPPAGLMAVILGYGTTVIFAGFGLKGLAIHKGAGIVTTQITETGNTNAELKAAEMITALREKHPAPALEHRAP